MRNLRIISICLVTLFLSVAITSNISTSSNNQAFATHEDSNTKTVDSIKKACPNYEGNINNNIKGLVTDILKACLPQGNQPPTTTPGPTQETFPRNMLELTLEFQVNDLRDTAEIVITDTKNNYAISYNMGPGGGQLNDRFVVPIGDDFQVNVTGFSHTPGTTYVADYSGVNNDCPQTEPNICTGTMDTKGKSVSVAIEPQG